MSGKKGQTIPLVRGWEALAGLFFYLEGENSDSVMRQNGLFYGISRHHISSSLKV